MTAPLDLPARPAIAWATSLPKEWARGKERMVLMLLAADHSAGTPAPGRQTLADWAGLTLNQVDDALRTLTNEIPGVRPPIVERIDDTGTTRPAGSGRHNTRFRLRTDLTPNPPSLPAGQVLEQAQATPPAPTRTTEAPVHNPVHITVERNRNTPRNRGGLGSQPPQQPPQNLGASPTPTTKKLLQLPPDRAREPRLADLDAAGLDLAVAMLVGVVVAIRPEWSPKAIRHAVKQLPAALRARHSVDDLIHAGRHWAANRGQKHPANLGYKGHWPQEVVGVGEAQEPDQTDAKQPASGVRTA